MGFSQEYGSEDSPHVILSEAAPTWSCCTIWSFWLHGYCSTFIGRWIFAQIHLVHQLYSPLEWEALLIVTPSIVNSQLDICNVIYMELPLKTGMFQGPIHGVDYHLKSSTRHRDRLL